MIAGAYYLNGEKYVVYLVSSGKVWFYNDRTGQNDWATIEKFKEKFGIK